MPAIAKDDKRDELYGLGAGVLGALAFALTGILLNASHRLAPEHSLTADALARTLINLAVLFIPQLQAFLVPSQNLSYKQKLLGTSGHWELCAWGLLGGVTLLCFYGAIVRIGIAEAAFLQTTQGIFIALLSPRIAKQAVPLFTWLAVIGSALGMVLLFRPNGQSDPDLLGRGLAIASGFSAGLAYLVLSRLGSRASAIAVSFYWSVAGILVVACLSAFLPFRWPQSKSALLYILAAASVATFGQIATTIAYQRAKAAKVAAVTYLTPVFALTFEFLLNGRTYDSVTLLGAGLIIAFGAVLPFLRQPISPAKKL